MKLSKVSLGFMILLLVAFASACSNEEKNNEVTDDQAAIEFPVLDRSNLGENIVAVYDGGEITGEEFATFLAVQAFLNPNAPVNELEFREEIIKELIMEKAINQNVSEITDSEQMDLMWEQIEYVYGEERIEEAYERLNISEADIRNTLQSMFNVEAYFRDNITDEELLAYYEEVTPELITSTFSHILVATEEMGSDGEFVELRSETEALERANELYEQLIAGADINDLATEFTDDEGSAASGGRYEDVLIAELVPEFQEALITQPQGEIGEPVKTAFGYHIIKVEELQQTPFEEVEAELRSSLVYEKYMSYFFKTLNELNIEITL